MIGKITHLIINASLDKDDGVIVAALKLLKNNCNLEELVGDYFAQLVSMIPLVKEQSTKALLIETIVESPEFVSDDTMLDEYVKLISEGATNVQEAARCLGAFTASGCTKNQIFLQLANKLNDKFAVEILVSMGGSNWGRNPSFPRIICSKGSKSTKDKISFRNNCSLFINCSSPVFRIRSCQFVIFWISIY
ncbi:MULTISPECIES: hypothetical protein [Paenibacillus]|uniref:hypothetical protein n=1 Tax=Paenibacillus TaxID=44249 RepID=UPI000A5D1A92|nr:hypothetical protein [Paenibacillus polymyxa]